MESSKPRETRGNNVREIKPRFRIARICERTRSHCERLRLSGVQYGRRKGREDGYAGSVNVAKKSTDLIVVGSRREAL